MVTTAADLTVVPCENGVTIIYRTDSPAQTPTWSWLKETSRDLHDRTELSVEDLDICNDRGRNLDHMKNVIPMVVRDTAAAYLYLHCEDEDYRVYLRPVGQLDLDI